MPKIFINYRREDSGGHAGRMYDKLVSVFQEHRVFMDVDSISPGVDFPALLAEEVAQCDVFLALIGPGWLQATDAQGRRRIDNPMDFVRIEIKAALQSGATVIPVLLPGASIPDVEALPSDLKKLARLNAFRLGERFHPEMDQLILHLGELDSPAVEGSKNWGDVAESVEASDKSQGEDRQYSLRVGCKQVKILGALLLVASMALPMSVTDGISYNYVAEEFDGEGGWFFLLLFAWPVPMLFLLAHSGRLGILLRVIEIPLALLSLSFIPVFSFMSEPKAGTYAALAGVSAYVIGAIWEDALVFWRWISRRTQKSGAALKVP